MASIKPKLKKMPSGKWRASLSIRGSTFKSTKTSAEAAAADCLLKVLNKTMMLWHEAEDEVGQLSDQLVQAQAENLKADRAKQADMDMAISRQLEAMRSLQGKLDNAYASAQQWQQRYEQQRSHGRHLEVVLAKHGIEVQTVGLYCEPAA